MVWWSRNKPPSPRRREGSDGSDLMRWGSQRSGPCIAVGRESGVLGFEWVGGSGVVSISASGF